MAAAVPGRCPLPAARDLASMRAHHRAPTWCCTPEEHHVEPRCPIVQAVGPRSVALRRVLRAEPFCARARTASAAPALCQALRQDHGVQPQNEGAPSQDDGALPQDQGWPANLLLAQDDVRPRLPTSTDCHVSSMDPAVGGGAWFDQACLFHPIVIPPSQEPQSPADTWRMYYYGRPGGAWGGGVPALLTTGWVGVAESMDGLTWTRVAGPLEGGAVMGPRAESPGSGETQVKGAHNPLKPSNPGSEALIDAQGMSQDGEVLEKGGAAPFAVPLFDSAHVACGDVLPPAVHGDAWRMLYFGGATASPDQAAPASLGKAGNGGVRAPPPAAGHVSTEQQKQPPAQRPGVCMRIGLATSPDGICFPEGSCDAAPCCVGLSEVPAMSRSRAPLLDVGGPGEWDSLFVAWPRAIPLHGKPGHWLLTYSSMHTGEGSKGPSSSIGAAISEDDGATWQKVGRILEAGPSGAWDERGVSRRHILWLPAGNAGAKGSEGLYLMFYEGVDAQGRHSVGLATSADGLTWEKDSECTSGVPGGPVLAPQWEDPLAWDAAVVAAPCVVPMADGSFRMYYSGQGKEKKNYGIGLAVSDGLDFRTWSRPCIWATLS